MKKYFIKIAAMAMALILPFAVWYGYIQQLQGFSKGSVGATIQYKIDLIKDTEGSRVVLVGGSSSPYGTVCADIAQQMDMPCINIGATAYLGLEYYTKVLDRYVNEGDIVVIAPEHILLNNQSIDYTTVWMSVENDADALSCIPVSYYPGMFSTFKKYSEDKISSLGTQTEDSFHSDFGPNGDVVAYREPILEHGYNTQDLISFDSSLIYHKNLKLINHIARKIENKGATAVFAFAPVNRLAVQTDDAQHTQYQQAVDSAVDISIVLGLGDAVMDGSYFFDSNNHLTTEGAQIYTQKLIDGLKEYLQ